MGSTQKRILVLYRHSDYDSRMRAAIWQHLRCFDSSPNRHRIIYYNAIRGAPRWLRWLQPDAIVLHTTILCERWHPEFRISRRKFDWISRISCPKIALPQDEYDHSEVLEDWLSELGATVVFTCFPDQIKTLYPRLHDKIEFRPSHAGFIDENVAQAFESQIVPLAQRPVDIVYRATQLPFWFGSHGQLKHEIGTLVAERSKTLGLKTDISTQPNDAILGSAWLSFVGSGRAIIGCESGSSVLDRRGEIRDRIQSILKEHPKLSWSDLTSKLPPGWDNFRFFAISPRHLEAAITKTCQILVEGSYSGILEAERHYIPIKRDLSNLNEALSRVKDLKYIEAMTERAYQDIVKSGSLAYRRLTESMESIIVYSSNRSGWPWSLGRMASGINNLRLAAEISVKGTFVGRAARRLIRR